jgi:hypothetical protein
VFDTILQYLLLLYQFSHVRIGILPRVFLEYLQPHPEILILILQHKYVGVEIINVLPLLLNVLPQTQVTLKHLLHHVDCVDDTLSDRILGLIDCAG